MRTVSDENEGGNAEPVRSVVTHLLADGHNELADEVRRTEPVDR